MIFDAEGGPTKRTEQIITPEFSKSLTIGFLQGGGSLIGLDLELQIDKYVAIQLGGGFVGYGAGLNFHFKPVLRSSFFSLQYWHQGIANSHTQSGLSANFVYRGKKGFVWKIGLGFETFRKEKNPFDTHMGRLDFFLSLGIGFYVPF